MKQIRRITILISIVLFCMQIIAQNDKPDAVRTLSPFNEIKVFGTINCELIQSDEEKVEIYSKNITSDRIVTELAGNQLKIRLKIGIWDRVDVKVIVYYHELEEITASAGADLYAQNEIDVKRLEINANTGSTIKLNIDTEYLELSSEQGSKVILGGEAETMDIDINTGGSLHAFDCKAEDVYVKIHAGGLAEVYADEKIKAEVNLGGTIKYKGDPESVSQSTNLGGSIYKAD